MLTVKNFGSGAAQVVTAVVHVSLNGRIADVRKSLGGQIARLQIAQGVDTGECQWVTSMDPVWERSPMREIPGRMMCCNPSDCGFPGTAKYT